MLCPCLSALYMLVKLVQFLVGIADQVDVERAGFVLEVMIMIGCIVHDIFYIIII